MIKIELCTDGADDSWLALRSALWPHASREEHLAEMAVFFAAPQRYAQFVAQSDAEPAGLVEVSRRTDYVNGTETSPVGFLEGLYVTPAHRRRGIARALVDTAQRWAFEQGCREVASDALLDNPDSHAVHRALGFVETERVVCFVRRR